MYLSFFILVLPDKLAQTNTATSLKTTILGEELSCIAFGKLHSFRVPLGTLKEGTVSYLLLVFYIEETLARV